MPKDFEEFGVLDHIGRLSSAEDIFTYLLLPFEEGTLRVSRLHIMKRFGTYLRDIDADGLSDLTVEQAHLVLEVLAARLGQGKMPTRPRKPRGKKTKAARKPTKAQPPDPVGDGLAELKKLQEEKHGEKDD